MRCFTGSQWSSLRIGVMLSYFRVRETRCTAAFCTRWFLSSKYRGSPASSELQLSCLDDLKACTNVSISFSSRYFLILNKLLIWKKADLHIFSLLRWRLLLCFWLTICWCYPNASYFDVVHWCLWTMFRMYN